MLCEELKNSVGGVIVTKIKKFLLEHEITVLEIAKATGISRQHMSGKVNGRAINWGFCEVLYISKKSNTPIEKFEELLDIKLESKITA